MNIQKIIKNTFKAGALALALTSSAQVFGQSVPPEGGTETVHNSDRGIRWVANSDASNHNEGYGFYLGSGAKEKLALRIGHSGNVGIGVRNPTAKLEVNGQLKTSSLKTRNLFDLNQMYTSGNGLNILTQGGKNFHFNLKGLGIGVADPSEALDVGGNGKFGGNLNATNGTFNNNLSAVNGTFSGDITANRVRLNVGTFPDYVFAQGYDLMPLEQVEAYIKANQHLPKVPAAAKVIKEGMDVGQINVLLMEKVEELTLHTIEQHKQIKQLMQEVKALKTLVNSKK